MFASSLNISQRNVNQTESMNQVHVVVLGGAETLPVCLSSSRARAGEFSSTNSTQSSSGTDTTCFISI